MAEQEDLEQQLNNVSDDDLLLGGDDGSELEESELSVRKKEHRVYSLSLAIRRQRKHRVISCRCKMIAMKRMSVRLIFPATITIPNRMGNLDTDIYVFTRNSPHPLAFGKCPNHRHPQPSSPPV